MKFLKREQIQLTIVSQHQKHLRREHKVILRLNPPLKTRKRNHLNATCKYFFDIEMNFFLTVRFLLIFIGYRCGKLFKSSLEVEYHATKSGHDSFSESLEEKKPLTEEEKKEKLRQLEEKMRQKRKEREEMEKQEMVVKEKMRIKSGKEMAEARKKYFNFFFFYVFTFNLVNFSKFDRLNIKYFFEKKSKK